MEDGRIVEVGYHANYSSPFSNVAAQTVSVEGLPWALDMKKATAGVGRWPAESREWRYSRPAFSPQPAIETMNPIIVTQGDSVTVTLTGFNFVRRSTVYFKGRPAPFRIVSSTEIQVTLDPEALREAGRFGFVVRNPEPLDTFYLRSMWGSGTSNVAPLIVKFKWS